MRSDIGESGSESGMDGDNINVVIRWAGVIIMIMKEHHGFSRVRPISQKEVKANDDSIIQFPGEGQIWVRKYNLCFFLNYDGYIWHTVMNI